MKLTSKILDRADRNKKLLYKEMFNIRKLKPLLNLEALKPSWDRAYSHYLVRTGL